MKVFFVALLFLDFAFRSWISGTRPGSVECWLSARDQWILVRRDVSCWEREWLGFFCRFWFGVEFVGLKSNKKWKKWRETFQPQSLDPQVEDKPQGTAGLGSTYWNGLRCQKRLVNTFKVSYLVHGHGVNWVTTLESVWRNWWWVADSQLRWQRVLIDIACCFTVLEVF